MVRRLFIALFAASALPFSPLCQGALAEESRVIDGIAAIVNGDILCRAPGRAQARLAPAHHRLALEKAGGHARN